MASLGDTAEGGANEEFSDIIKWRSGMLVHPNIYPYSFIIEMIGIAESWWLYREDKQQYCWASAVRKLWLSQKSCMDNLSSHGGRGPGSGATKVRREQEKADRSLFARWQRKSQKCWPVAAEERRMMGWVEGATPWDTFLCSSTSCCSLLL